MLLETDYRQRLTFCFYNIKAFLRMTADRWYVLQYNDRLFLLRNSKIMA